MQNFETIDDVVAWFKPMDYEGFWYAVSPYNLTLQPKDHCDAQIKAGEIDEETVLYCLKAMARNELTERHGLKHRESTPWLQLVSDH